ncbi:MAG: aminotransferase class I/II-fold pyridoxal phosphate-dependent enzyme, partial [Acetanaerobacterium sp.]
MSRPIDTPLYRALRSVIEKDDSRFHMPGHKGCDRTGVFGDVLQYDVTEINGTDSLYHASDAILHCEQRVAAYYGAKRSLISVQGSTLCIQTMLSLARRRGRTLVIARGAHVSAANAIALLDYDPVWVYPAMDERTGVSAPPTPVQIEAALTACADVAAVYITSPSYYGALADVTGIARVCARRDVPLLVDNAHGAHLKAAGYPDPIGQGAAMCAQSAHKTLPVLTGGAFLHIADDRFAADAKEAMAVFGSTSPSYLIMLSLDTCVSYLETDAAAEFAALRARMQVLADAALAHGFTPVGDGTFIR